jgi:hypothetical protein
MTWTNIRLELARTPDFPEGSPAHAYLLRLPLDQNGMVDADAYRAERGKATVQRAWPGEAVRRGAIIHKRSGWAFSYEAGDADDEGIFHLENHPFRVGEYVTVTEPDGERLPYRIVSCRG